MQIIGLSGRTGSGKSTNSLRIGAKYGADFILDDGLLIRISDGKVVGGISAKSSEDYEEIISIVLFQDDIMNKAMRCLLNAYDVKRLLIVSLDAMAVSDIAGSLGYQSIGDVINIEDEVDYNSLVLARQSRNDNKHCILGSREQVEEFVSKTNSKIRGKYIIVSSSDKSSEIMYVPA
jgi:Cytidylate kinase